MGFIFFFLVAICLLIGFVSVGWPVVFDNLMTCCTSMTFCLSDSALANLFHLVRVLLLSRARATRIALCIRPVPDQQILEIAVQRRLITRPLPPDVAVLR